jgi:hypothetical protein
MWADPLPTAKASHYAPASLPPASRPSPQAPARYANPEFTNIWEEIKASQLTPSSYSMLQSTLPLQQKEASLVGMRGALADITGVGQTGINEPIGGSRFDTLPRSFKSGMGIMMRDLIQRPLGMFDSSKEAALARLIKTDPSVRQAVESAGDDPEKLDMIYRAALSRASQAPYSEETAFSPLGRSYVFGSGPSLMPTIEAPSFLGR